MTEILLFHSALGRRRGVLCFAKSLREAGHRVHVPDLFDGETFDDLEKGMAKRSALGIPELIRRAEAEAAGLDPGFVAAGFSMGAAVAQYIAGTTPGARAAVLVSGAAAPGESGVERWPEGAAVQVHYAEHDPWVDAEEVAALEESVRSAGAVFQAHIYAGSGHLFTDPDLPEYDAASAGALQDRMLAFIEQL